MPIANCIVTPDCTESQGDLLELWSKESGKSVEHMTINIITRSQQLGNGYAVMANLILPSVWSNSDVSLLQVGLAKALATYFNLSLNHVHVVTQIVDSGLVVENGAEIQW